MDKTATSAGAGSASGSGAKAPRESQRCPVCQGHGILPHGFYSYPAGHVFASSGTAPERCRTCDGEGFIHPSGSGCAPGTDVVALHEFSGWPAGVSDGLTLPCSDCGVTPMFDYRVTDAFWRLHVPDAPARLSVVCLPCLNGRCGGEGLAEALVEVQWTGTGHTVVLRPTARYAYADAPSPEPNAAGPLDGGPKGPESVTREDAPDA